MLRLATERLARWADAPGRRPLLVRGARQVGKTWLVTDFARTGFPSGPVTVDLEVRRDLHSVFAGDLTATRVLSDLELALGRRIVPGDDLLFLDEIQACPRAIMALRSFFEELPELHVVAAGSLLEFAVGEASFPVGRVEYLWLYPMSFAEFLSAVGSEVAAGVVRGGPQPLPEASHAALLSLLGDYFRVGGMPAAVAAYTSSGSILEASHVHDLLVTSFRDDFARYRPRVSPDTLDDVLTQTARSVGSQLKYARLAPDATGPTAKSAFGVLERAQLVSRVGAVSRCGLPVGGAGRRFKAIVLDVGLMQRLAGIPMDVQLGKHDLLAIHNGAVAEQFVGQELRSCGGEGSEDLHYWSRAKGSAEVDYVMRAGAPVRPVEVKSGPAGRLRSLHQLLLEQPECAPGVVLSEAPYAELPEQGLVFCPLYFAGSLGRSAFGASA
jgi:predicted AAA+ superfamily ATPase